MSRVQRGCIELYVDGLCTDRYDQSSPLGQEPTVAVDEVSKLVADCGVFAQEDLGGRLSRIAQEPVVLGVPGIGVAIAAGAKADGLEQVDEPGVAVDSDLFLHRIVEAGEQPERIRGGERDIVVDGPREAAIDDVAGEAA